MKYTSKLWMTFPLCGIAFSSILLFKSEDIIDLIFVSLPWIIFFHLFCPYILGTTYMFQLVYFKIICLYLSLKLKNLNKDIEEFHLKFNSKCYQILKIRRIIVRLNDVHEEIKTINEEIWSKFLFIFIVANIAVGNFSFYVYMFVDIALIVKVAFLYCTVLWFSMLCYILDDVSAIVKQVNKSRKLLIKLFVNHSLRIHCSEKLKVSSYLIQTRLEFYFYQDNLNDGENKRQKDWILLRKPFYIELFARL